MIAGLVRRAQVVGVGLIGGSIAKGLKTAGWHVTVADADPKTVELALSMKVADESGFDSDASIIFIATPMNSVIDEALNAINKSEAVITDVGSAKRMICDSIVSDRFVGGHPMAGSEMAGLAGANENLFQGATWFITPDGDSSDSAVNMVFNTIRELGANPVAIDPQDHDSLVARVSHIPYLASAALVIESQNSGIEEDLVAKAAAGGFRDMTRIAGGNVEIWPGIIEANSIAITDGLRSLAKSLNDMADKISLTEISDVKDELLEAKGVRTRLAQRAGITQELSSIEFTIEDKPGQLAQVTKLAASLNINLFDISISHSSTLNGGRISVLLAEEHEKLFSERLSELGFSAVVTRSL